jgi:hypothetical protein
MKDLTRMIETTRRERANGVARRGVDPTNILIVETDSDCADALQALMEGLPCVGSVQTTQTLAAARELLDAAPEVVAFAGHGAGHPAVTAAAPDVIFFDGGLTATDEVGLRATLVEVRRRLPDATVVLLCVYPDHCHVSLSGLIDSCIPKDTNARELRALLDDLCASGQSPTARAAD